MPVLRTLEEIEATYRSTWAGSSWRDDVLPLIREAYAAGRAAGIEEACADVDKSATNAETAVPRLVAQYAPGSSDAVAAGIIGAYSVGVLRSAAKAARALLSLTDAERFEESPLWCATHKRARQGCPLDSTPHCPECNSHHACSAPPSPAPGGDHE